MSLFKYKKGAAEGFSAMMLFILCIIAGNLIFFVSQEFGWIEDMGTIKSALVSTCFTLGAVVLYFILARNLVGQGVRKEKKKWHWGKKKYPESQQ